MANLETLHKAFLNEWAKPNKDLNQIAQQLQKIEIALSNFETLKKMSPLAVETIHKDFYEISVLYNVQTKNLEAFQESMTKVHCFYESLKNESTNKYLMYGLHLLYFLATSKISQFHMLLEQIDQIIQKSNPYINIPVRWEQFMMEGAYNKVLLDEKNVPTPYYSVFVTMLYNTIRDEVASCVEKSYKRLQLKDAAEFLFFDKPEGVLDFGTKRGWRTEGSEFIFDQTTDKNNSPTLDTKRIAKQNLFYAKQLEMII